MNPCSSASERIPPCNRARLANSQNLGPRTILAVLILFGAGGAGYYLRGLNVNPYVSLAVQEMPALEYYLNERSFSEIENAKALLEALSARFITESRVRLAADRGESAENAQALHPVEGSRLAGAVKDLEQGIEEFKGTGEELLLVQDLLWVLKKERCYDRWIEVYLDALYQHPTHELVGRFAGDAILMGKAAGRETDVFNGFRHVSGIPLQFEAKRRIKAAVIKVGTENQVALNDGDHLL